VSFQIPFGTIGIAALTALMLILGMHFHKVLLYKRKLRKKTLSGPLEDASIAQPYNFGMVFKSFHTVGFTMPSCRRWPLNGCMLSTELLGRFLHGAQGVGPHGPGQLAYRQLLPFSLGPGGPHGPEAAAAAPFVGTGTAGAAD
jgi:hypothetical protein